MPRRMCARFGPRGTNATFVERGFMPKAPFLNILFAIYDRPTGQILFVGRVVDPS